MGSEYHHSAIETQMGNEYHRDFLMTGWDLLDAAEAEYLTRITTISAVN